MFEVFDHLSQVYGKCFMLIKILNASCHALKTFEVDQQS
jgi:hypothetical protein